MYGPEQVNVVQRPSPIFLEGTTPIRITEEIALQLGLKDGQTVRAVIENRGDLLRLVLNQRDFDLKGNSRFKAGDKLDFKVSFGLNGVMLKPVNAQRLTVSAGNPNPAASGIPTGLLALLHRPKEARVLLNLFKPSYLSEMSVPIGAKEWIQKLDKMKSSMEKLSSGDVRKSVQNSGLFGESNLLKGASKGLDMKQILRGLLASLPDNSKLFKAVEQVVTEVEGRQVDSLNSQSTRDVSLQFVIPFHDAHAVDVEIMKENQNESGEQAHWVVNLHTESPELGDVWLKSKLLNRDSLEMTVWAPRGHVAESAVLMKTELEYELKKFGLNLDVFSVLNATRPTSTSNINSLGEVIDIST